MTTTRCYCCKYRSTERVSVNKFDCVQLGILRNQFGKKRYYLALGMGPNVGPKWRAVAIFFPSHDKNVSSGGILSARRCLRTRIFFLYGLRDHEYFMHTKFHQNPSSGSGEEVENVKVYGRRRRTTDGAL